MPNNHSDLPAYEFEDNEDPKPTRPNPNAHALSLPQVYSTVIGSPVAESHPRPWIYSYAVAINNEPIKQAPVKRTLPPRPTWHRPTFSSRCRHCQHEGMLVVSLRYYVLNPQTNTMSEGRASPGVMLQYDGIRGYDQRLYQYCDGAAICQWPHCGRQVPLFDQIG